MKLNNTSNVFGTLKKMMSPEKFIEFQKQCAEQNVKMFIRPRNILESFKEKNENRKMQALKARLRL